MLHNSCSSFRLGYAIEQAASSIKSWILSGVLVDVTLVQLQLNTSCNSSEIAGGYEALANQLPLVSGSPPAA